MKRALITIFLLSCFTALAGVPYVLNTKPEIIVSPKGVLNGLSSLPNDGAAFGPDTPGTTTCGLQEALNTLVRGSTFGPNAQGLKLRLAPGYFFYTNTLWYYNSNNTSLTIEGNDPLSTMLVYAGSITNTNCIYILGHMLAGSGLAYDMPMHVWIRDVGFSALTNDCNILLCITNYSTCDLERCRFTMWEIMTNKNAWGSGMSLPLVGGAGWPSPALVGVKLAGYGDNLTHVSQCYFTALATGIHATCDHLYSEDCEFAAIGFSSGFGLYDTEWPRSSPYCLGACILRDSEAASGESAYYRHAWYNCAAGLLLGNFTGSALKEKMSEVYIETVDRLIGIANTNAASLYIDDLGGGFNPSDYGEFLLKATPVYAFVNTAGRGSISQIHRVVYDNDQFFGVLSKYPPPVIYVDPTNGVSGNSGNSPSAPKKYLVDAVAAATPGTTIFMEKGLYDVGITNLNLPDGSKLIGALRDGVIVKGKADFFSALNGYFGAQIGPSNNCVLSDFTLQCDIAGINADAGHDGSWVGIGCNGAANSTIKTRHACTNVIVNNVKIVDAVYCGVNFSHTGLCQVAFNHCLFTNGTPCNNSGVYGIASVRMDAQTSDDPTFFTNSVIQFNDCDFQMVHDGTEVNVTLIDVNCSAFLASCRGLLKNASNRGGYFSAEADSYSGSMPKVVMSGCEFKGGCVLESNNLGGFVHTGFTYGYGRVNNTNFYHALP